MEPGWDDSERRFARVSALGVVCVAAAYLLTGAIGLACLGASPPGSVTPPEPFVTL
jgi:hypothetical protein